MKKEHLGVGAGSKRALPQEADMQTATCIKQQAHEDWRMLALQPGDQVELMDSSGNYLKARKRWSRVIGLVAPKIVKDGPAKHAWWAARHKRQQLQQLISLPSHGR